jgi:chromosome segregation ATPase
MNRPAMTVLLLLGSGALLPGVALADAATEAKLRDALRSTATQLRALEDERATWQGKEAAMKKELEALRAQPKAPRRNLVAERELEEAKARAAVQAQAAAKLAASLERCEAERAEATRATEQARTAQAAESARLSARLAAAEAKNERIYQVGKGIIDWLEREGVGGEPFLGLRRVALENAVQDQQDKLIDQRIKPLGAR